MGKTCRSGPARTRGGRPGEHHTQTLTRLGDATHARPASRARRTPAPAFPPIAEPRRAPSQHARHPARRRRARPKRRPPGAGLRKPAPGAGARATPAPDTRLNKGVPEKQHTQPQQSQRESEREERLTLTPTHQGVGRRTGGEPQTHLGRLQRVVLPVKRDCSADNPNSPCDYFSCAPEE